MRFALGRERQQADRVLWPSRCGSTPRRRSAIGAQTVSAFDSADGDGDGGRLGPDEAVDPVRGGGAITAGEVLLFLGA